MRYSLRTLLIVLALAPPLIVGVLATAYLGWARFQGEFDTDGGAVGRELERARTAVPFDPTIHMYPYEDWAQAEERQRKAREQKAGQPAPTPNEP